ncbi:hypothetical protein OAP05_03330 [Schleiferiaceae bacterium]|nr:hypothetical protein [Schleiferiaceae bacterium]
MTNTLPIHELVQELRRADINISANVSENLHGILDFSYESPMEFNGHAEREGNEPNAPIRSKSVIYENSFR